MTRKFRITHPFHPLLGQEFEFLAYRRSFRKAMVEGRDAAGRVVNVWKSFTDQGLEEDPFLLVSAGRSCFRVDDLLLLADLLAEGGR